MIVMTKPGKKLRAVLSSGVGVALFFCQIIGALCPMALIGGEGSVTIQSAHIVHSMNGDPMCLDGIVSSKPAGDPVKFSLVLIAAFSLIALAPTQQAWRLHAPSSGPPVPPLPLFLSAPRI
jgi:hypothetical protein